MKEAAKQLHHPYEKPCSLHNSDLHLVHELVKRHDPTTKDVTNLEGVEHDGGLSWGADTDVAQLCLDCDEEPGEVSGRVSCPGADVLQRAECLQVDVQLPTPSLQVNFSSFAV